MAPMRKKADYLYLFKSYFYYQVTTQNEKKLLTIYAVSQSLWANIFSIDLSLYKGFHNVNYASKLQISLT